MQKEYGGEQVAGAAFSIHVFTPPLDEASCAFSDTAAVMMNLDLAVTSDTSVAHPAGGLGRSF